ncbi:MAG: hypothetical protein LBH77_01605 [Tannerella sp.]|nr:hypothetical protein [Tannerella sp.]
MNGFPDFITLHPQRRYRNNRHPSPPPPPPPEAPQRGGISIQQPSANIRSQGKICPLRPLIGSNRPLPDGERNAVSTHIAPTSLPVV